MNFTGAIENSKLGAMHRTLQTTHCVPFGFALPWGRLAVLWGKLRACLRSEISNREIRIGTRAFSYSFFAYSKRTTLLLWKVATRVTLD